MTATKDIKCPNCGKDNTWQSDNEYKPFCSYRCKLIDLGEWAEGRSIPGESVDPETHDEENDSGDHKFDE